MRFVSADQIAEALPVASAIDALERAFAERDPVVPMRTSMDTRSGSLLLMPAEGPEGVGVKLVTITDENPERNLPLVQAVYVLFGPETQEPLAVLDGTALTSLRTAAVSGLATRHLALPDVRSLVIFGAGAQARSHLGAMAAVRPIEEVVVVSRSEGRAEELCAMARAMGLEAGMGTPEAVADARLICTCTTSSRPVFDGSLLLPGAHVNAIGAYLPDARELDAEAVRRSRLVVETRDVAMAEAGDLLLAIEEGAVTEDHVAADLAEVVRGRMVRRSNEEITVFESVGLAFEDLVVASAIMRALS